MTEKEFEKLPNYELEQEKSTEIKKIKYTWDRFIEDIDTFCKVCKSNGSHPTGVYGLPRGGLIPAVILSHKLNIPLLMAPCEGCIIVDDIADSGKSLAHYTKNDTQSNNYFIFTLYYAKRSIVEPNYCSHFKAYNEWVIFPWEEEEQC